ncbi:MAG: hypothetical protein JWN30_1422, partial [Bacilli bacterium]|nr:hypothetical protein [Bacilli bacterium]
LSTPSKYDSAVEDIYAKAAVQVAEGSMDINTALRNAEDEANKAIAAAKQNQ